MRVIQIYLVLLLLSMPLVQSQSFAAKWGATKSRKIVPADSHKRYELKIKLKYSRDTMFTYSTYVDKSTFQKLESTSSIRRFTKYISKARKKLLMKKRAYSKESFLVDGWEKTVYASLEKIQLKDKYWSKTRTVFEK